MKLSKEEKIRQQQKVIMEQEHEIERLNSIIKEVREYINKTQMGEGYKKMLLEILDRRR